MNCQLLPLAGRHKLPATPLPLGGGSMAVGSNELGTCAYCARLKKLDGDGLVVGHYLAIPVSRSAVRYTGAGRVRRRCQGSGKAPRRPLGAGP